MASSESIYVGEGRIRFYLVFWFSYQQIRLNQKLPAPLSARFFLPGFKTDGKILSQRKFGKKQRTTML